MGAPLLIAASIRGSATTDATPRCYRCGSPSGPWLLLAASPQRDANNSKWKTANGARQTLALASKA